MAPRPARAAAALVVLLVLLAAGCRERPSSDGPVTLVFKHAKILGPADPVPGLLRRFEAEHPGVRVVSEALTWSSDEQHQFYVINLEGGSPPFDVMMLDVIWVPEFARAGWILDLTPFVPAAERAAHFASAIEPAVQDGRLWALPWFMNVGLLYYRKDLLAKYGLAPPRTYDELIRQVRAHPGRGARPAPRRLPLAGQAVRGRHGQRAGGALGQRHAPSRRRRAGRSRSRSGRARRSRSCAA